PTNRGGTLAAGSGVAALGTPLRKEEWARVVGATWQARGHDRRPGRPSAQPRNAGPAAAARPRRHDGARRRGASVRPAGAGTAGTVRRALGATARVRSGVAVGPAGAAARGAHALDAPHPAPRHRGGRPGL